MRSCIGFIWREYHDVLSMVGVAVQLPVHSPAERDHARRDDNVALTNELKAVVVVGGLDDPLHSFRRRGIVEVGAANDGVMPVRAMSVHAENGRALPVDRPSPPGTGR